MTKVNPNQESIDFDDIKDGLNVENSDDSLNSLQIVYKHRATGKRFTFDDVDRYATARPCSYHQAFKDLGLNQKNDITDKKGNYIIEEPTEPNHEEKKKPAKYNMSVNLGERALLLLKAIDEYDQSVDAHDNFEGLRVSDASDNEIDQELSSELLHRYASEGALSKALHYPRKPKVGFSPIETRAAARDDKEKFFELLTSTDQVKKDERDQLVETLERQIK